MSCNMKISRTLSLDNHKTQEKNRKIMQKMANLKRTSGIINKELIWENDSSQP